MESASTPNCPCVRRVEVARSCRCAGCLPHRTVAPQSIERETMVETDQEREGIEHFDTVIIGGGQSGLAMGYHLKGRGESFVILDANDHVGHVWRERWDSLRLFTPTWCAAMPGMRFPGKRRVAPTKDEMAEFLEAYVARFELPVRGGTRVDGLRRQGDRFVVAAGDWCCTADHVVVATGAFSTPWRPSFASEVDPRILQLHSSEYRNPGQLRPGGVLVVGAGNSGCDIALDVAARAPDLAVGPSPRPRAVPHRRSPHAAPCACRAVRGSSRADPGHTHRSQGDPEVGRER